MLIKYTPTFSDLYARLASLSSSVRFNDIILCAYIFMTLNPTKLIQELKNLIEQLYHYKQSLFFKLHFAVIVLIGIAILWVYLQ